MQMQFNLRNALNKCFFVQHCKESKFVNPGIPKIISSEIRQWPQEGVSEQLARVAVASFASDDSCGALC